MTKCIHHPGRKSVISLYQKDYCIECKNGIFAARVKVKKHCEPRECFITYFSANNWQRIEGTGCAHYVAHRLKILSRLSLFQCLSGYITRVVDLIPVTTLINLAEVQLNDIYITPDIKHTGIVTKIEILKNGASKINITHASSGQNIVAENDFTTYFFGKGTFRRYDAK